MLSSIKLGSNGVSANDCVFAMVKDEPDVVYKRDEVLLRIKSTISSLLDMFAIYLGDIFAIGLEEGGRSFC